MNEHKIAVMQPYIFPYLGYFHLIQSSELFIFYDDVNYIKRGWINRNKVLCNGKELLFTIPVQKASMNKLIMEISPLIEKAWIDKFYNQLYHSYRKAPYFDEAIEPIMSIFDTKHNTISDLAIESITTIYSYLGINFKYNKSSICSPETRGMDKADRLIEITKKHGFENYVNAPGGKQIYSKDYFASKGVNLSFIKSSNVSYSQYSEKFVDGLSVIDVIMFNSKEETKKLLSFYTIE
ncbi:WbqC family protein [Proteinivorax hydrogeniformans]|uniref:WbqC family protein n=1 Tax=Proteinivorax hydrogeniformans TaxID=1826727 RepID=A0AAU8HWW1_9FIRM